MKASWNSFKLSELASKITDGSHNPPKGVEFSEYIMLSSRNVYDDEFHYESPRYLSEENYKQENKRTQIAAGDVLLTIVGTIGRVAVVPTDAPFITLQRSVAVIKPIKDKVIPRFLMYHLIQQSAQLNELARGVAQKGIYLETLRQIEISAPSITEQQRIVAKLDQAFEGIAKARTNAEKNLQNARALFESHLQSVFSVRGELVEGRGESWINATLGQYIKFIDYRGKTPEKTEGGLRLITAKNVKMGYLQINPREYVAPKIYDSWMTRGIPRLGDVLFTTEAPLANVAQLDTDEKVVFAQRIIIMQPDASKLDSTFLKYMLLSEPIQKRIHDKGTGATVKGIKASLLKNIQISFPNSVSAQAKIVDKFDALSAETQRLEALYQRKIALLDELKKSLLQQAFAGEL